MFRLLILIVCVLLSPALVGAADDPLVGQRVIITSPQAEIKLKDKVVGRVRIGEVFTVKHANPTWVWVHSREGWVKREHVLPLKSAETHFTQKIQQNPKVALSYEQRGVVRRSLKMYPQAIEDFGRAIELDKTAPSPLMQRGHAWQLGGNPRQAIDDFSLAIEQAKLRNPKDGLIPLALSNRSDGWLRIKQYERALADAEAALKLAPEYPDALINRGVAKEKLNKPKEAVEDYSQAIKLRPTYALGYRNRGSANIRLKDYKAALKDLERALSLDDESWENHNELAWLLATCDDKEIRNAQKAVELAQTACKLSAYQNPTALDTLAAAYSEAGQHKLALEQSAKAVKLASKEDQPTFQERQKEYQKAAQAAEKE